MSERAPCPAPVEMLTTQDGVIFPLERAAMRGPLAITARMASDMAEQIGRVGYAELAGLLRMGWTQDQVMDHWQDAWRSETRLAATKARLRRDARAMRQETSVGQAPLGQEIAAQAFAFVCVGAFVGAILMIAGA